MYSSILVPIEMSGIAHAQSTIDLAKSIGSDDVKITLLHVFAEIPTWAATNLPQDIMNQTVETARRELEALADKSGDNVHAEVRVGHAYKTILDTAEETEADMIILESHQPGLQDYFLGSTASKVVRHADCSVLVMR